jgi:hypothetical protein
MKEAGITPNQIVFTSAMEACAEVREINEIVRYEKRRKGECEDKLEEWKVEEEKIESGEI